MIQLRILAGEMCELVLQIRRIVGFAWGLEVPIFVEVALYAAILNSERITRRDIIK